MGLELIEGWLTGLATADFDQDGHLDVVVARLGTDLLLRGTPEGFSTPTELPGSGWTTSMAAADLDGDGDCDLVRCATWNLIPRLPRRPRPTKASKCWADRTGSRPKATTSCGTNPQVFAASPCRDHLLMV